MGTAEVVDPQTPSQGASARGSVDGAGVEDSVYVAEEGSVEDRVAGVSEVSGAIEDQEQGGSEVGCQGAGGAAVEGRAEWGYGFCRLHHRLTPSLLPRIVSTLCMTSLLFPFPSHTNSLPPYIPFSLHPS